MGLDKSFTISVLILKVEDWDLGHKTRDLIFSWFKYVNVGSYLWLKKLTFYTLMFTFLTFITVALSPILKHASLNIIKYPKERPYNVFVVSIYRVDPSLSFCLD